MYKVFSVLLLVLSIAGGIYVSSSSSLADEDCINISQNCDDLNLYNSTIIESSSSVSQELPVKTYIEKKDEIFQSQKQSELQYQEQLEYNKKLREEGKIIVEEYESKRQETLQ